MTKSQSNRAFVARSLNELTIDDERVFRDITLYNDLKRRLLDANYKFRIATNQRSDRALLLNLTLWGASDGGDILSTNTIAADVVAHVGWHHAAASAWPSRKKNAALSVDSMFAGEAIASAFDLYLVGMLLRLGKKSRFLDSQVPAMSDAAQAAGLNAKRFSKLLERCAADPELAFEHLRQLLFDATGALFAADSAVAGDRALAKFDQHPFAPLLHHYELSNWVLYARAYGDAKPDVRVRVFDAKLRSASEPMLWLREQWLE
jgi:hypothetical protein